MTNKKFALRALLSNLLTELDRIPTIRSSQSPASLEYEKSARTCRKNYGNDKREINKRAPMEQKRPDFVPSDKITHISYYLMLHYFHNIGMCGCNDASRILTRFYRSALKELRVPTVTKLCLFKLKECI